jgi:peroxiredoxin
MKQLFFILIINLVAFTVKGQTVYQNEVGKDFPVCSFTTIDGEKLDSLFLKNKVIMYNFYIDACQACRIEMKGLNQLYDKYFDNEIVFIAITPDNVEKTRQTQEKYELKFKMVSLESRQIAELTHKTNYPTNIIVGKTGKVAFKESGTVIPEYWTTKHILETFGPIIENLKLQ